MKLTGRRTLREATFLISVPTRPIQVIPLTASSRLMVWAILTADMAGDSKANFLGRVKPTAQEFRFLKTLPY
jgi:hypothetical protein